MFICFPISDKIDILNTLYHFHTFIKDVGPSHNFTLSSDIRVNTRISITASLRDLSSIYNLINFIKSDIDKYIIRVGTILEKSNSEYCTLRTLQAKIEDKPPIIFIIRSDESVGNFDNCIVNTRYYIRNICKNGNLGAKAYYTKTSYTHF